MNKKLLSLLLCIAMLLGGCGQAVPLENSKQPDNKDAVLQPAPADFEFYEETPEFISLDDANLQTYVEDLVYRETVSSLNSDDYFVENVSVCYVSEEFLKESAFNSESNIFFGYTLDGLNEIFRGSKYIFTLNENGETGVKQLETIHDDSVEKMIKNVAVGTGVILVCVTVSLVPASTGFAAVSAIFAASAKSAATLALGSAAFGGISSGIVKGIRTGDFDETIKAAALGASEGFKWGAISGAIAGGAKELFALKSAAKNGLTMNQAACIQKDSKFPVDVIKQMKSKGEYEVYQSAGLKSEMIDGKTALVQKIDLDYVSELPDGTKVTNLMRAQKGYAPLDPVTGEAYELHHIGQNANGTLAMLTREQHRGAGNFSKLHDVWNDSGVSHGSDWAKTVSDFWKSYGNLCAKGGI